jgi:alkaline phosphatase D
MRVRELICWVGIVLCGVGCVSKRGVGDAERVVSVIAFGSCINTNEHPMLDRFLKERWDVAVMAQKYEERKGSDFWRGLRKRGPVMATWDDHDFGGNDAGADYPMKEESQRLFLEFMDEPALSERCKREGVYETSAGIFLLSNWMNQRLETILINYSVNGSKRRSVRRFWIRMQW